MAKIQSTKEATKGKMNKLLQQQDIPELLKATPDANPSTTGQSFQTLLLISIKN